MIVVKWKKEEIKITKEDFQKDKKCSKKDKEDAQE